MIKDDEKAKRDFDHEVHRILRQYAKKVKQPYIDLDPKVKMLEFTPDDMVTQTAKDTKNSMTTSKSQQQPSAGGTASNPTGNQVSGQSTSEMKDSSHQSVSEKTSLSVSGMLKAESEISLRDESHQGEEELSEDVLKPLKILERLLAQSKYHKQQVRYKDYPFTVQHKNPEEKKEGATYFEYEYVKIDFYYQKIIKNKKQDKQNLLPKVFFTIARNLNRKEIKGIRH